MPWNSRSVRSLYLLGLLAGTVLPGATAEARDFSADLLKLDAAGGAGAIAGKVFVAGDKVRIETADVPGGFFLLDGERAAYFVRPSQHIYMDAKQSSWLSQLLVPVDPADPCRKWQAMAVLAGAADQGGAWRCEKLGADPIDGRPAVKYATTSPKGQHSDGWIDPSLGFLVRIQAADDAGFELHNIREDAQPESLFEIPASYLKFDPQRLIEQIKQSDVWVEPPK